MIKEHRHYFRLWIENKGYVKPVYDDNGEAVEFRCSCGATELRRINLPTTSEEKDV